MLSDQELYDLGKRAHCEKARSGTANFGLGWSDGHVTKFGLQPCHGVLQTLRQEGHCRSDAQPLVINNTLATRHSSYVNDDKKRNAFLEYLLNESPFSQAYLSHDIDRLVDDGVIVRLDMPANYVVAASIAVRHVSESSHVAYTWNELVRQGLDKNRAYLSAFCMRLASNKSFLKYFKSAHTSVYPCDMSNAGVRNFINRNLPAGVSYAERCTYGGIDRMWNKGDNAGTPLQEVGGLVDIRRIDWRSNTQTPQRDPFKVLPLPKRKPDKKETLVDRINAIFDRIMA